MASFLVVGLGNPGQQYAGTRHNVGFRCVDVLANRHGLRFDRKHANALLARGSILGRSVTLAKPQTFMNLSGKAVRALLGSTGLGQASLVVVYDDLDLPLGRIRVRERGSAGGHKGVRSIIDHLGGDEFVRVRVGVGRPPSGDSIDYVLGKFTPEELALAKEAFQAAASAVECLLAEGVAATMNKFNREVAGEVTGEDGS